MVSPMPKASKATTDALYGINLEKNHHVSAIRKRLAQVIKLRKENSDLRFQSVHQCEKSRDDADLLVGEDGINGLLSNIFSL